jgi:hypothetical protein
MNWAGFRASAPELAEKGEQSLGRQVLGMLGTIRRDGSPRLCPIEVILTTEELCMGMHPHSLKARDLKRDPRCSVHSVVAQRSGDDIEFKVGGLVREIQEEREFEAFAVAMAEKVGWRPTRGHGFFVALDIERASFSHSPSRTLRVWTAQSGSRAGRLA